MSCDNTDVDFMFLKVKYVEENDHPVIFSPDSVIYPVLPYIIAESAREW